MHQSPFKGLIAFREHNKSGLPLLWSWEVITTFVEFDFKFHVVDVASTI
jgi:hypothetical protein